MRLLNVKTMKLERFMADPPEYSILSHRWGPEEVTFQDLATGSFQHLKGYQKIAGCCEVSRREGFEYTWIDTCCIDKSSSAELTEALNSMFTWYKRSSVCYSYLDDVGDENPRHPDSLFANSRWFTRGWTLQELIAPDIVVFLSSTWRELGTRADLAHTISTITGINPELMLPLPRHQDITSLLRGYSIACKMSWAAKRVTTRTEDKAYCLMGLFEVNMPLLYGEGDNAFIRLQKEIINASNDFSIFAWEPVDFPEDGLPSPWRSRGMLAPSPRNFESCSDVSPSQHDGLSQSTFEISKSDIRMRVPTISIDSPDEYLSLLVREGIDPNSSEAAQDIRTVLHNMSFFPSLMEQKFRAFIAILPCEYRHGGIGIPLMNGNEDFLQRDYGLLFFQDLFKTLPTFSTFHVPITINIDIPSGSFLARNATIKLAPDCLIHQSDFDSAPLSSGDIVAPSFTDRWGGTGSLLIRNNNSVQLWPGFIVVLGYNIDDHVVVANCMAIRDTELIRDLTEEIKKLELKSSEDTSEVRVPLTENYEAVLKFRVNYTGCKVLVGVENSGPAVAMQTGPGHGQT